MSISCHIQLSAIKHVLHISTKVVSCFERCKLLVIIFLPALLLLCCNHVPKDAVLPPRVTPGPQPARAMPPPADAEVLFDGASLDAWQKTNGKPAGWAIKDSVLVVRRFTGDIQTRQAYGDIQLHVEWMTPPGAWLGGQHRGNSGIKFMGLYEVQILDSFDNLTYPDGQAGAVYGQHAPRVNAARAQGAWQSYDIIFRRPRFNPDGTLGEPARLTVLHNGILIQENVAVKGPTRRDTPNAAHPDQLPRVLQNHRSKVRFRNIWVRTLLE